MTSSSVDAMYSETGILWMSAETHSLKLAVFGQRIDLLSWIVWSFPAAKAYHTPVHIISLRRFPPCAGWTVCIWRVVSGGSREWLKPFYRNVRSLKAGMDDSHRLDTGAWRTSERYKYLEEGFIGF
jgi:hypothetical protein